MVGMRAEIRKHQKGTESKEGDDCGCGRQTSTLGEAVSRKRLFFPFFFSFSPSLCHRQLESSSNLVEAREGESAGPLGLCHRFALYVERDHSRLHGTLRGLPRDPASLACNGHSAVGIQPYGRIGTPLPPYCVVVQGRKAICNWTSE